MTLSIAKQSGTRFSQRHTFHAHAQVRMGDAVFPGEIINISNRGAYLMASCPFAVNDAIELTVYFNYDEKELSITLPCSVARIDETGLGLTSAQIDADMLLHFEVIFDLTKENSENVLEELFVTSDAVNRW